MCYFYITIAIILILALGFGVWYLRYKVFNGFLRDKIHNYMFLFKFFLIGKYHCNLSAKERKVVVILHKLFWCSILVCVCVTIARTVEILQGVD